MISEGWWDTEDWINENSALRHRNNQFNTIVLLLLYILNLKECSLDVNKRRFSKNIFQTPNFFNSSLISLSILSHLLEIGNSRGFILLQWFTSFVNFDYLDVL